MDRRATVGFAARLAAALAAVAACGDDTHVGPGAGYAGSQGPDVAGPGGAGGAPSASASSAGGVADGGGGDECPGPFDPDGDGDDDGPRHDRPSDPQVVASCGALCDAVSSVCGDALDRAACVDACAARACEACRRTFVPVVDCESVETSAASCTCEDGVPRCPIAPGRCSDYLDATRQCATAP